MPLVSLSSLISILSHSLLCLIPAPLSYLLFISSPSFFSSFHPCYPRPSPAMYLSAPIPMCVPLLSFFSSPVSHVSLSMAPSLHPVFYPPSCISCPGLIFSSLPGSFLRLFLLLFLPRPVIFSFLFPFLVLPCPRKFLFSNQIFVFSYQSFLALFFKPVSLHHLPLI